MITFRFRDRISGRFVGTRNLPMSMPLAAVVRMAFGHGFDAEILKVQS